MSSRKLRLLAYGEGIGSGGYLRYCKGLFGSGAAPADVDIFFVCSPELHERIKPLDHNVEVIIEPWISSASRIRRYLWHGAFYQRLAGNIHADVEFYPSGRVRNYLRRPRTITTCHNLLLFDAREMRQFKGKRLRDFQRYRAWQVRSLRRASATIFLSPHSQRLVCAEIPDLRNTTVIPHGLDSEFLRRGPPRRETHGVERLLCVSSVQHYKNLPGLVAAVAEVRRLRSWNLHLQIVGGADADALRSLRAAIANNRAEGYVHLMGEVAHSDLVEEYGRADAFVFPSSCETFGISLLEAMGMGVPIVCSNKSGLPELLGGGGVYFDPFDGGSIVHALQEIVSNAKVRSEVAAVAHQRAREYTWKRAAEMTFDFARKVSKIGARIS